MLDPDPLDAARLSLGLSVTELWEGCLALGGALSIDVLGGYLAGRVERIGDIQHDIIVQVLNESFLDRGLDHPLPYSRP